MLFSFPSCFLPSFAFVVFLLFPSSSLGSPLSPSAHLGHGNPGLSVTNGRESDRSDVSGARFRGAGGLTSEAAVEAAIEDPDQDWDRVNNNPDFLLMNGDEQSLSQLRQQRQQQRQRRTMSSPASADPDLQLVDALLSGRPVYVEQEDGAAMHKRGGYTSLYKRGKLLRLSLTNNIDVLREKLFMEIARRNRLRNQNQINAANGGLASIG